MGVVRIDDDLLKEIKKILAREGNKYKYGSIASFINYSLYEKLKEENKGK